MDYTKQKLRPLIYKDRPDIDHFDINDPKSLDSVMLNRIEDSEIVEYDGASKYILDIFNNAYYITTLILMEPHPVHYFRNYITIAEHAGSAYYDVRERTPGSRYFASMTMAMVWNYLCICQPDIYGSLKDNKLLKNIWDHHVKSFKESDWDKKARFLFFDNVLNGEELMECHVSNKFIPLHSPEQLQAMETKQYQPKVNEQQDTQQVAELKALIEAQQEEISKLEKQLKVNRSKQKTEPTEEELKTIESLKNDLMAFKTRDKKGKENPLFTAKQIAIFLKAILLEHNSLTNNAKNLAPLVQRFGGGFAPSTAENALGYEVTQKECDDMEKIFRDYAPTIGHIIKDYPKKFKEVKDRKLQNNLKQ